MSARIGYATSPASSRHQQRCLCHSRADFLPCGEAAAQPIWHSLNALLSRKNYEPSSATLSSSHFLLSIGLPWTLPALTLVPSPTRQSVSVHSSFPTVPTIRPLVRSPAPARSTALTISLSSARQPVLQVETSRGWWLTLRALPPSLRTPLVLDAPHLRASSLPTQSLECGKSPRSASPRSSWNQRPPYPENPEAAGRSASDPPESCTPLHESSAL